VCSALYECSENLALSSADGGVRGKTHTRERFMCCDAQDGVHSEEYTDSQATSLKVNADCMVEAIIGLILSEGSVCLEGF